MRRAVLVIFLALLTFNVSGLAEVCGDGDCDENCPTDASGGQCAPNCHFCSCCSLPKATALAATTLDAPAARTAIWASPVDRPAAPLPSDIMHVPKLVLA